jgi:hypothetical protein
MDLTRSKRELLLEHATPPAAHCAEASGEATSVDLSRPSPVCAVGKPGANVERGTRDCPTRDSPTLAP